MVLEEEFYFASQDTARDFVKLMRDLGISALTRQKAPLDIKLKFSGTYTDLAAMLDEIAGDEESDEDERKVCSVYRENITRQHDLIAHTLEKYQVGDQIGSSLFDVDLGDRALQGDEDEETVKKIVEEMYVAHLLHLNDLLEIKEDRITLMKKIDPDQAVLIIFAEEMPFIETEILEKHHIKSTITAGDDEEWQVTIGAEFVFLDDFSKVEEFFEEYDTDEDENVSFFTNIQIKQILVSEILDMIKTGKKATREEIIDEFSERDIETKEDGSNIALHLSRGYIDAVIDDLKKTGIIKGKDQKLRIAV